LVLTENARLAEDLDRPVPLLLKPVSAFLIVGRAVFAVPRLTLVLGREEEVLEPHVEVEQHAAVQVDRDLGAWPRQAAVVPAQPESRLSERPGSSVGQRREDAQHDDASAAVEARDLSKHLLVGEHAEPEHRVHAVQLQISVLLEATQVESCSQRCRHHDAVNVLEISRLDLALPTCRELVAKAASVTRPEARDRRRGEMLVGRQGAVARVEPGR
jgi:hypothetical protein